MWLWKNEVYLCCVEGLERESDLKSKARGLGDPMSSVLRGR